MQRKNLLDSRPGRFATFCLLYVSEGIPYGFMSSAMVAFMRQQGVSLEAIGAFTAALFLPWSLKFAWAPLVDLIPLRRFGGRKGWISLCLIMMIFTLIAAAQVDFLSSFSLLVGLIIVNNIFCATQDVAIDSLAVSTLRDDERGRGNGFMFGGQYLGIAIGGGGAIWITGAFGFDASLMFVTALLALALVFVLLFVRDPDVDNAVLAPARNLFSVIWQFLVTLVRSFFLSGTGPRVGFVFSLLPIATPALGYAMATTIQVDYGLNDFELGELKVYSTVLSGAGCLVGGFLGDRFGLKRVLWLAYALTAIPTLLFAIEISALGLQAVPAWHLYAVVLTHGALFGMAYGVRAAVFMGMTNPAVAATQFTGFMALANVTIIYSNGWHGVVAEGSGYATVLFIDAALLILPLIVIPFLRNREPTADETTGPMPESVANSPQ